MHINLIEILLAFFEGLALITSPCILPILPLVLSGSLEGGKLRPYGIILGFIAAFSAFALLSHQLITALNINPDYIKNSSLVLLVLFSLLLIFPALWERINQYINICLPTNSPQILKNGFWSGLLIGSLIGIIWTPCAGPIMAAALIQIIRQQTHLNSIIILVTFAIGAAIPMLIIALTGRTLINKLSFLVKHTDRIRRILGIFILLATFYIAFGMNASIAPITSNTTQNSNNTVLIEPLAQPFKAPEFTGIQTWLNSPALTIESLKGKVVLIDFWTYSCINCIRTLPYIISWDQKYRDKGLVIIGIHAPEFEFEKLPNNVKKAVEKFNIKYPVALDSNLSTWAQYHNRFWPAHYLIDSNGNVVYTHFGEGAYDITEKNIQALLNLKNPISLTPENQTIYRFEITPETYLGSLRASRYFENQSNNIFNIPLHNWSLQGKWNIEKERIVSQSNDATIQLHFLAKKVFLVMGNSTNLPISVTVSLNGKLTQQLTITEHTLYTVVDLPNVQNSVVEIKAHAPGLEAYAFTFGDE